MLASSTPISSRAEQVSGKKCLKRNAGDVVCGTVAAPVALAEVEQNSSDTGSQRICHEQDRFPGGNEINAEIGGESCKQRASNEPRHNKIWTDSVKENCDSLKQQRKEVDSRHLQEKLADKHKTFKPGCRNIQTEVQGTVKPQILAGDTPPLLSTRQAINKHYSAVPCQGNINKQTSGMTVTDVSKDGLESNNVCVENASKPRKGFSSQTSPGNYLKSDITTLF